MDRRAFLKTTALSGLSLGVGGFTTNPKTHILTISFDDGFKKSFYAIADIFEEYGLSACFNVIASGHLPGFQQVDDWILPELLGNFDDWNALKARGHELMPHSWKHLNLANQPLERAKELMIQCFDYFEDHLDGYEPSKAVFNFPFNSSTPELEAFALSKVLAIRSGGASAIQEIPEEKSAFTTRCESHGPMIIDNWVEQKVNRFLATSGGWMILNAHGLDNEGWGPMTTAYLKQLLKRLVKIETLAILPTGTVLNIYGVSSK